MRQLLRLFVIKTGLVISLILTLMASCPLEARTIKIGTDRWPPHEDIFNQEAPGFCTEVTRAVFKTMNVEISITQYPWARAVNLVFSGMNDALFCALHSEERESFCFFPEEALTSLKYLLFINKERSDELVFNTYDDLVGKRIGLVRAFAYPKEFMDFVKENSFVQEVESDDMNFKKLITRRIEYTIADYANGALLIKKLELQGRIIPLFDNVIHEAKLYLIFSKKTVEPGFVDRFSKSLAEYKKGDEYWQIRRKYYTIE
ncbi:transporter substrate-binding domain-containing protein [bacterium]|nr:transporter substrate-binding domain-containing protein [bacterium]